MTIEENKNLVRRFIDEIYNQGNIERIADFCVPGSLFAGGHAGQIQVMRLAFPDMRFSIDAMLAEGEKVVARVTTRGTNSGPLAGLPAFGKLEQPVPPTGQQVMSTAIYIFTLRDGKVVSIDAEINQIGMLQQMGWSIMPPSQA
jgi:predicted ester cyclase